MNAVKASEPQVLEVNFIGSFTDSLPQQTMFIPEIAFVGRSNVGKSTLVNRVTQRRKIARVSSTPGRTRQVNLFSIKIKLGRNTHEINLTDLPGFGYAKVSKRERNDFANMIEHYLSERAALFAVCILNDIRREPQPEELAVRDFCMQYDKHVLVVATKCDKLGRNDLEKNLKRLSSAFGLMPEDVIASGEGISIGSLWWRLSLLLQKNAA